MGFAPLRLFVICQNHNFSQDEKDCQDEFNPDNQENLTEIMVQTNDNQPIKFSINQVF
jgi:hypothetical protein